MKSFIGKIVVFVVMVALLGGCAGNSFMCKNKDTILAGLQFVISQSDAVIAAIRTQYPGVVPDFVQAILDKAQQAHDMASTAISAACPAVADLTKAQESMTMAVQKMQMAGMKVGK